MDAYSIVTKLNPIKNALTLHLNGRLDHIVIETNKAAKAVIVT